MTDIFQVSHQNLQLYINGDYTKELKNEIEQAGQHNPEYQLLFEIIDDFKKIAESDKSRSVSYSEMTFREIDDIINLYFSGQLKPENANNFLSILKKSPQIYQRLLVRLKQLAFVYAGQEDTIPAEIRVKPDEEILSELGIRSPLSDQKERSERPTGKDSASLGIVEKIRRLIDSLKPVPRYRYLLPAAIACLLIVVFLFKNMQMSDRFDAFQYDDKVPLEYNYNSFRGASDLLSNDPQLVSFDRKFKLAIGNYMLRNYQNAIQDFFGLESQAELWLEKISNKKYLSRIRNLYFYSGLSHLGLARSIKSDTSDKNRTDHLTAAINYISRAENLAEERKLSGSDREKYFMGIIYALLGEKQRSVELIQKIEPGSYFWQKGQKLIKLANQD